MSFSCHLAAILVDASCQELGCYWIDPGGQMSRDDTLVTSDGEGGGRRRRNKLDGILSYLADVSQRESRSFHAGTHAPDGRDFCFVTVSLLFIYFS